MSHPQIADAKRLAKRDDLRRCVVLFERMDGRVGYASYGADESICAGTREIMDEVFDDWDHRVRFDTSVRTQG